jgi:hypothetical protein
MVLQHTRRTANHVAMATGGLLPHLFTLTLQAGRLFSVTLLYPYEYLPVRKRDALCCPDFPPAVVLLAAECQSFYIVYLLFQNYHGGTVAVILKRRILIP